MPVSKGAERFPYFLARDSSEVRKQSGKYGEAFADYEKDANLEREQILKWRDSLTEAGHLTGCHIQNQ